MAMPASSSNDSSSSAPATLTISPDPGLALKFSSMQLTEELGRPFEAVLDVTSATRSGDVTKLIGTSATVVIQLPKQAKRYFNGIVTRAVYAGVAGGSFSYQLEVRPWIWLLTRSRDCRIFQNESVWDIVTAVFRAAGFSDFADKRQNAAGSTVLEYCVQFEETAYDFVMRLMERYGFYFFVTHSNGTHTLEFADDPNSHSSVGTVPFRAKQSELRQVDDHMWDWSAEMRLTSGQATFRDYNFTTPSADLTVKSVQPATYTNGSIEVYDYPGRYPDTATGQKLVTVHMQDIVAGRAFVHAATNARTVAVGTKFTLSGNDDTTQNAEYLVVGARTSYALEEGRAGTRDQQLDQYSCTFTAMLGTTPFRLEPDTLWPRMRGPQTARVVGQSGQEITTDQYGRIKVLFPWDRVSKPDQNASCWIRVAQRWAGAGWGGMVIPRIGMEVIVDFLDGNPDRPIVTGCVYNATNTVPYALPGNMTRSTFKTNSSQGGGGFNELCFEDKKGSEEVYLHAQKDYTIEVLNNQTTTVTQDRTTTVQKGNDTLTVQEGNRSVTVSEGNESLTVSQGNRTVTVSTGNDTHTVSKGSRAVTVSTGDDTHTVSKGNRTATVTTGNDSLTVTTGNHSISVSTGGSTIEAAQSITLKVGMSSVVIDLTGVTIKGPKIALSAIAELTADGGAEMTLKAGEIAIN